MGDLKLGECSSSSDDEGGEEAEKFVNLTLKNLKRKNNTS